MIQLDWIIEKLDAEIRRPLAPACKKFSTLMPIAA
jgi:hypothetical protein